MTTLPKEFQWLLKEDLPSLLKMAVSQYGTMEKPGPGNNPSIMQWAKDIGVPYSGDEEPWCGVFVGYCALQTRWDPLPPNLLGARNWLHWQAPAETPMLGDVLVFWRGSRKGFKGHVGFHLGETADAYCVLGGNQGNMVSIRWIAKNRLLGARRCHWRIAQPASVRVVHLQRNGNLSTNEV